LSKILLSLVEQASQQNLIKLLTSQNLATLKKILQCYIICQYDDNNFRNLIDDLINNVNERDDRPKQIQLYDTNELAEKEKDVLSMFENNFEMSLSYKRPLIKDVMLLLFSYFNYWEIGKYLALIDKQWNSAAKTYKSISYYHGHIFLTKDDFKRMNEIGCIDYRREEDGKFVKATYFENAYSSCGIILRHSSNIINYKSGLFDPNKYSNIMAYHQSIVNQKFSKNEPLLKMKNELVQGKLMDIKLKDCYLIYNNIKYFQIRITEWMCGIIFDLQFLHNNGNNNNDDGNKGNNSNNMNPTNDSKNNKNNIVEKQPYTSQIPFIVDVTDWCKSKCKNDNADTIYHNLYSYDFEKKKIFKSRKKCFKL